MADLYVRSTDGDNADDGSTWALAKLDGAGAAAIDVAGDTIFFSDAHAESTAAAITWALAGTIAAPTRLICGDDVAEPPTAVATTGTVTTTGASAISISSTASHYMYGLSFFCGTGAGAAAIKLMAAGSNARADYESCSFQTVNTGQAASQVQLTTAVDQFLRLTNCTFKFAHANQGLNIALRSRVNITGGSVLSGGTSITNVFIPVGSCSLDVENFDFSNLAAGMNIASNTFSNVVATFRNCKLPASWSGSLNASTPGAGSIWEMHNCDSGDTNYRIWKKTQFGDVTSETTIIKTGGASDGTTGLSWKMVSNADPEFPDQKLSTPEMVVWNDTVGSAVTVTVDVIHSGVGGGGSGDFTDRELWLDVQYLGTSGFPLGLSISDAAADVLATAADQDNSTATWTSEPATPVKQKLIVTFTPQEKGYIHARVNLALASKTVYVDSDPVVT